MIKRTMTHARHARFTHNSSCIIEKKSGSHSKKWKRKGAHACARESCRLSGRRHHVALIALLFRHYDKRDVRGGRPLAENGDAQNQFDCSASRVLARGRRPGKVSGRILPLFPEATKAFLALFSPEHAGGLYPPTADQPERG